jgi:predicted DNA-binding protein
MGRPALGLKQTSIRLPVETIRRIEALMGRHQLAAFIREAVESELRRRENEAESRPPR